MDSLFSILKFTEICLIFIPFIYIYIYIDPEQLYVMNSLKCSLYLYARLCVTKHF